jgi:hypothetical protein
MFLCRRVSSAMSSCSLPPALRINTHTPSRQFTNPFPFTAFAEKKHTMLLKDSYNSSSPPPLLWIPRENPLHKKTSKVSPLLKILNLQTLSKTKIGRLRKLLAAKTSAEMSQNWGRRISACKQHACSQRPRYCAGRWSSEIVEATANATIFLDYGLLRTGKTNPRMHKATVINLSSLRCWRNTSWIERGAHMPSSYKEGRVSGYVKSKENFTQLCYDCGASS